MKIVVFHLSGFTQMYGITFQEKFASFGGGTSWGVAESYF